MFLEGQIRMILAERERLAAARCRPLPGVTVFPSDANFILLRTDRPSREVFEALRRRGVLVRDLGGSPGMLHGCLRVTVGVRAENDAFLEAMREVFGSLARPERDILPNCGGILLSTAGEIRLLREMPVQSSGFSNQREYGLSMITCYGIDA